MNVEEIMPLDWVVNDSGYKYQWIVLDYRFFHEVKISPIPLTQEILKANASNGITPDKEIPNGWLFGNEIGMVWENEHLDFGFIQIRYVHKLQQLLRLCGLKRIANNFKIE